MLLAIRIPCLIFNSIGMYFALSAIHKNYSSSEYSPRLFMISILIVAAFPSPLLSALPYIFNYKILSIPALCYAYTSLKSLHFLSRYSLLILTFYVLLILFTSLKRSTINKIGHIMILIIFIIMAIIEFILLPYFGAIDYDPLTINNKTYNRACGLNSKGATKVLGYSILLVSTFVFIISIILFIYYYYINKISPRDKKHKLFLTLSLFGLVGCVNPLIFFFEKFLKFSLNKAARNVVYDFMTAAPGLYSTIYYFVEVYSRGKDLGVDIKFILRIYKTRKIYKEYLEERGERALWNMLVEWEKVFYSKDNTGSFDVLDQKNLTRANALELLEKYLSSKVLELIQYDKFYYCILKLQNLGEVGIDLMLEDSE